MSSRLLVIALDGADGALLNRWCDDGSLPNLATLKKVGAMARLSSPPGITDDGLWASFQYGCGLGEHGRYFWRQPLKNGQMGMTYKDESDRTSFWDALSRCGMRVAVFDVPKCGAPKPINGLHLVDWLVHGRYFPTPQSFPEWLAEQVVERFGPAPPSICGEDVAALNDVEVHEMVANLRDSTARKCAAGRYYLSSEAWDLFVIGFKEAHCAGHHLWDLADPRRPDYDPNRVARLGDPLRKIFIELDHAIGQLLDAAGQDAVVAVLSTTGMQSNATLMHLMPDVLDALNRRLGDPWIVRFVPCLRSLFGSSAPVFELLPYNENAAALRIHPRRGLPGLARDEAWREAMLREAEALLGGFTEVAEGRPVIAGIDRPSSENAGARSSQLPDLLVRCLPGSIPRAIVSPQLGRFEAAPPALRTGNHADGGLLILHGAPIEDVNGIQDIGKLAAKILNVSSGGL